MKQIFLILSNLFIIFLLDSWPIADADLAALTALRNAIGGLYLLWNITDERPCNWTGVTCEANKIVELRLPGMDLSGPIPPPLANLASLRNLYLQDNFLCGEIPEFLFNLHYLVALNLANNNFTGTISPNFNKLTRLSTLYLEGNKLKGSIPDLNLGSLDQFNVSSNNLTGSIPETLSTMPASSFEGNYLCGKPLLLCNGGGNNENKLYGWILMGCFMGFFVQRKRKKQREEVEIPGEKMVVAESSDASTGQQRAVALSQRRGGTKSSEAKVLGFDLEDLLGASAEVLGKGIVGTTYKANLETGTAMVVKRWKDFSGAEQEFGEMVETIDKTKHENLFPLTAYYYSSDEKLLVYSFMPTGSLYALLHGNTNGGRRPLNWDTRIGIALGTARAIAHIHSQSPTTAHGNIKSSNILLTTTLEARVSEYGLAQYVGFPAVAERVSGYRAPELDHIYTESQKADVYSFGVVFLELLTSKDPTESYLVDEGMDLPRWMVSAIKDEWTSEVFDVEILRSENVEVLLQYLRLAFSCTAVEPLVRPPIDQVITGIEELRLSSLQERETRIYIEEGKSS